MFDSRSNYGQKDAPTPGQDTKAKPPKWRGPSFTGEKTTDVQKSVDAHSGSTWQKQLLAGALMGLFATRGNAQEVPTAPRTRDGHGNELVQRDVEHHSLEPRRVVGSSDSLPYENRGHPDLPSLQVDGVKVPRLTEEDVKAVLQQKKLPEKTSRMTQLPAFDKLLGKLAKNPAVIESIRPLCYQDQEEVGKLLDNPEFKKCIEDLASKPGFQDMVKAVDKEAFKALQEYNANKKGENEKGPMALVKAMGPVIIATVVGVGIMYKFGGDDRRPIDGGSHSWGPPPGIRDYYADLRSAEGPIEERKRRGRKM